MDAGIGTMNEDLPLLQRDEDYTRARYYSSTGVEVRREGEGKSLHYTPGMREIQTGRTTFYTNGEK